MILAGVKAVTVHDAEDVRLQDLSAQFYLSEASVGTNRAIACRDKLQELNTAVAVFAYTAELTEQFISQFQVLLGFVWSAFFFFKYDQSVSSVQLWLYHLGDSLRSGCCVYKHNDEGVDCTQ